MPGIRRGIGRAAAVAGTLRHAVWQPAVYGEGSSESRFIVAKQVELLYRAFLSGAAGTLLVSVFFVAAMWGRADPGALLGWLVAVWWVTMMRALLVRHFHKRTIDPGDMRLWEDRFCAGSAAAGILWGLTAFLFVPGGDEVAAMLVVLFVAGVSATASALLASSQRAVALFLLPSLILLSARMFAYGDRVHFYMGAAVMIYLVVMLTASRRGQTVIWNAMLTGMENERLKGAIVAEKMLVEEREKTAARLATLEAELQYREIFENITDGLFLLDVAEDRSFRIVGANPALERMTGIPFDRMHDQRVDELMPTPVADRVIANYRRCVETGAPIQYEVELEVPAGMRTFDSVLIPMHDHSGRIHRLIGITRDITERKRMDALLHEREQAFRNLVESSPDIIVRYDTACRRIYSNAAHARVVGRPTQLGKTPVEDWAMPTGPEVAVAYQAHLCGVLDSGQPCEWELGWTAADGSPVCYLVRGVPEFDQEGKVVSVLAFARDISERKRLEIASVAREQEFRALVENSPDFVTRFDRDCRRVYMNPTLSAILGAEAALGKTPMEYYPGLPAAAEYEARLRQVLDSGEERAFLFDFSGQDGRSFCADMRIVPERDSSGAVVGVLAIGRDISERLRLEEEMRRQASYDSLTGLPNRRLFNNRLHEEVVKAGRNGEQVALLFIDLDRFKEVNDTLGHEVGDLLLMEAAQRIQGCVRESDSVARLGGDEFVAIFPEVSDLSHLGRVAQAVVDAVAQPFHLDGQAAYISASIGIAGFPMDADSADMLLACADQAMYAAKNQGRNGFSFFTATMQAQAERRLRLAHDLRGALAGNQLQVLYQPIVDIATGAVVKAEALLRWRHPVSGLIPPDEFIPVAEETGAIHEIGDWVFREAAKTALRWRERHESGCIQVSVNISPRQFVRSRVGESWIEHLATMGLPASCMVIEITEGLLLDDQDDIMEKLGRLREAGIRVALDDFGTGYSAMAYLKKFNIDYLKIDRSFVRDLTTDASDRAIAEAIVVMAHKLGLKTIAEGVETAGQRDLLAAVGCEYLQGYLYARPMPADEFLEFAMRTEMKEAVE